MKRVSDKDHFRITNCTGWFNLPYFTVDDVNDFLNSLGYDIIIYRAEARTQIKESVWGTGEVRNVGIPVDMMREFVIAVKPDQDIPSYFTPESIGKYAMDQVFYREIKKKLLK